MFVTRRSRAPLPRCVWPLMLGCSALIGCSIALERGAVSQRFSTVFNCDNPKVTGEAGGYRAEGCGVVAHFRCFDTDRDSDSDEDADTLGGAIARTFVEEGLEADTCIMEHSERQPASSAPAASEARPVARAREGDGSVSIRARILFRGGHLALLGRPAKFPDHALLSVKSIRALTASPCAAELFVDGVSIPLEQVERYNDHEARLLIRAEALRDADQAVRVAGAACGAEFELDANGRAALGLFEARFREEHSRLAHSTSGGETAAPTAR